MITEQHSYSSLEETFGAENKWLRLSVFGAKDLHHERPLDLDQERHLLEFARISISFSVTSNFDLQDPSYYIVLLHRTQVPLSMPMRLAEIGVDLF